MDYHRPIFILGNPRSGTTLLRLMVNCHAEIVIPPESGFLQWWYEKYKNWDALSWSDDQLINQWGKDLASSKKIETWELDFEKVTKLIRDKKPENYATLIGLIYAIYGNGNEQRWGDKNNYYINHIPLLLALYPHAQFIHLVRDGRDVACSYRAIEQQSKGQKYAPELPQKIEIIAAEWLANNKKVCSFFGPENFNADNYLRVKYESLLIENKKTLEVICAFLKLDFDSNMLNYYQEKDGNKIEPAALIFWKEKTKQKPDIENIGKYKKILSTSDIEIFNAVAGKLLNYFGYAL